MILLALEEFVIALFQKKFLQVENDTEADHVVVDLGHVTDAPAQEDEEAAETSVRTEPDTV